MREGVIERAAALAVEYAVMLALIIVVCLASITVLGSNSSAKFVVVAKTIGGG